MPSRGAAVQQRGFVEQAQAGDHDAFAVLARAAAGRLDGIARLMLRDPDDARDAVQEALIRAWRDLPGLRDPERFDGWLYRLTVHACIDSIRRRRRQVHGSDVQDVGDTTAGGLGRIDDRELLGMALGRLRPDWRAVVVLHYYVGLPLPEAANVLGIPVGTAQSRHHRSLRAMRSLIEADEADEADEAAVRHALPGGQLA